MLMQRINRKDFLFRKVNSKSLYINAKSNQPYKSYSLEEFNKAKPLCNKVLSESNYKASLQFEKPQYNTNRNRLRKAIWFNPPFNQNVKINIRKTFLKARQTKFLKHHKLNKIFNKNTLKLSYCNLKNMSSIIY